MRALFYYNSTRHYCNDVSSLDSGQAVSNDNTGSSFSCFIQSGLNNLQENKALSGAHSSKKLKYCMLVYNIVYGCKDDYKTHHTNTS